MATKKQEETKQVIADNIVPSVPTVAPNTTEQKPPNKDAEYPADEKYKLLERLKNSCRNYKFRQVRNDPRFWIEVAALITVVIYTIYSGTQARVMNQTLEEIRKQTPKIAESADAAKGAADTASASIRPWLKIKNLELRASNGPIKTLMFHWPLTGKVVPPNLQVKASIVNMGHSVAQDAEIFSELFFGKFESDKWHDVVAQEENRFCQSVLNRTPSGAAVIVFPSEPSGWNMGVVGIIHDTDIMNAPGTSTASSAATLIVCVNYRGVPQSRFQTQSLFYLYENNSIFVAVGVDADAKSLRLIRDESGDHAN